MFGPSCSYFHVASPHLSVPIFAFYLPSQFNSYLGRPNRTVSGRSGPPWDKVFPSRGSRDDYKTQWALSFLNEGPMRLVLASGSIQFKMHHNFGLGLKSESVSAACKVGSPIMLGPFGLLNVTDWRPKPRNALICDLSGGLMQKYPLIFTKNDDILIYL